MVPAAPVARLAFTFVTLWFALLVANSLLHFAAPSGPIVGQTGSLAVGSCAALLCAVGACRGPRATRGRWLCIAGGTLAWNLGNACWMYLRVTRETIPVPSLADAGFLLYPLLVFVGAAGLARPHLRVALRAVHADALAAAAALGAVSVAVVLPPIVAITGTGSSVAVVTNLAYPVTDMVLAGLVVGVTVVRGGRPDRTWSLIALGVASFWVADTNFLLKSAHGSYVWNDPLAGLWVLSPILLALAAWQRPASSVAAPVEPGRRAAALPLVVAAVAVGVLVLAGIRDVAPGAIALAVLSLACVGARLWLTLGENVAMLAESRREALTDALTGLGNRRALEHALERQVRSRATLVMLDLDGFKAYNDRHGHLAGDELLARLGGRLRVSVAPVGSAFRMGGDEFCVLLAPTADPAPAIAALSEDGGDVPITASHGVVQIPEDAAHVGEALRLADERMYARKRRRRELQPAR